ncbi:MAG: DUF393 domain-containing protein [Candidatus Thermoplasmatota archaeon]|jgi:predicted DCC family thiol-disulfide oxidoreductase YuxK|nr:DUF393 domain-containing protein [Candidatus Thermoplasmatota archaeon]MCL6090840.1 DUF393 domain-containing protein [Candidatus Thermoplasmatota archaeon]MDA8143135.1 DUF393 domain-containing protein [Thermoplasmatales archaeon]
MAAETPNNEFIHSIRELYAIPGRRFIVIYDGACEFCKYSVRTLRRLDFLKCYSYISLQELSAGGALIPFGILQESIHVVDTKEAKLYRSMQAVITLLKYSPPSFPAVVLIFILRILGFSEKLYKWIATSRHAFDILFR